MSEKSSIFLADYSGAMVLQIPLDVACHVALQMQPMSKHRLWKHMQALVPSRVSSPVIRVVSMRAEENNRYVRVHACVRRITCELHTLALLNSHCCLSGTVL
jgi:hypothetical protein